MGLNDLAQRVAKLEAQMEAIQEKILTELTERKEVQKSMQSDIKILNRFRWLALGFISAVQIALAIALKYVFK